MVERKVEEVIEGKDIKKVTSKYKERDTDNTTAPSGSGENEICNHGKG